MYSELEAFLAQSIIGLQSPAKPGYLPAFRDFPDFKTVRKWSHEYVVSLLNLNEIHDPAIFSESRLRIALHLAPPQAVSYDPKSTLARWEIVKEFLEAEFTFPETLIERLSRTVASILDQWDESRKSSAGNRVDFLLQRQRYRCASCKLELRNLERVKLEEYRVGQHIDDPYKPYFDGDGVEESMVAVVDHINPVSKEGTNLLDNLQVLCDLCNWGKSNTMGVPIENELENAHLNILDIQRFHRARMLYYRLVLDGFACTCCMSAEKELTIRKVREGGSFVLTNLKSICYDCL